jgi:hypothetical protein
MSASHHKSLHQLPRIQEVTIALGSRLEPRKMSDPELLRFGIVAKYMCSKKARLEDGRRQEFASQLTEIRREWKRRFPSLPLTAIFNQEHP